jgi:hypothetical protein
MKKQVGVAKEVFGRLMGCLADRIRDVKFQALGIFH